MLSLTTFLVWPFSVVDVVEIGERRANIGDVLKVKPLAALAMIDEGELDWKIVAISLDDPKASLVNDVDDVEKHFPVGLLSFSLSLSVFYPCSALVSIDNLPDGN
jgi:inorganic pyrophosphatase